MSFSNLTELLPREINRRGVSKSMESVQICLISDQIIQKTLPRFAERMKTQKYQNQVLTIQTENSGLAEQVYLHSYEIIQQINQRLKKEVVSSIRTRIANSK